MGRLVPTFVIVLALITAAAPVAVAASMTITQSQSRRVVLRGSAATVVVGNPAIADVTMIDAHSVIVLGRAHGVTKVLVLDHAGRTLLDTQVAVVDPSDGRLTYYRGTVGSEFNCTPRCELVGPSRDSPTSAVGGAGASGVQAAAAGTSLAAAP